MLQQAIRNRLDSIGLAGDVATILTEVEVDRERSRVQASDETDRPVLHALSRRGARTRPRLDDARRSRPRLAPRRPVAASAADPEHRDDRAHARQRRGRDRGRRRRIPVVRGRDGQWRGIEAVIDKDFASSLLASELHAEMYVVLTGVAKVAIDFDKPTQRALDRLTVAEAREASRGRPVPGRLDGTEDRSRDPVRHAAAAGRS